MKKLALLIFVFPTLIYAQDCDCTANFNWVKTTFENNDAGFAYALEQKGEQAYKAHTEEIYQKIKATTDPQECQETIYSWLRFFRNGHIAIIPSNDNSSSGNDDGPSEEDIRQQFKDWERVKLDVEEFERYLTTKTEVDYEGIWATGPYRIAIKKVGEEYIGSIIVADGVYWQPGQVKLKIAADDSSVFYMRDHSARNIEETRILGNNVLQFGTIELQREMPVFEKIPAITNYFRAIDAEEPYLEQLDENTLYLRIPSFAYENKVLIDSVIASHYDLLTSTENLIIDIRYGTGGSDDAYASIIPLLYTNPIRIVGVEFLSTELNNSRMLAFANDTEYGFDDEMKAWAQAAYDKLAPRVGEFVNVEDTNVTIEEYDTVYDYPKNVGVIMHYNNGSTDEQFLLAAKQSKKVKLFGTTTQGVLDISNMMFVDSPCDEFQLGYSLSKSLRIPGMAIDGKGIQPDYYLDSTIPNHEWVGFVKNVLEQK